MTNDEKTGNVLIPIELSSLQNVQTMELNLQLSGDVESFKLVSSKST